MYTFFKKSHLISLLWTVLRRKKNHRPQERRTNVKLEVTFK